MTLEGRPLNKSVLVIDDDAKLVALLTSYLGQFAFDVRGAGTPELGLALLRKRPPDLVILDVMLPGKSGFDVAREIRRESDVPIIMLTARGDVTDRIVGLEIGADDYLPKPFEPRELVARMQTVLRRGGDLSGKSRLVFGALTLDAGARRASLDGAALDLSTFEYEALLLFAQSAGRVLSRDQIIDHLRGSEFAATDRAVDVLISRLRQKLGDDPKHPRFIQTVWGTGYTFVAKPGADGG